METKPKRGRPKTTGTTPVRTFRATDAEWQTWLECAGSQGKSVSDWLRALANRAAKKTSKKSTDS